MTAPTTERPQPRDITGGRQLAPPLPDLTPAQELALLARMLYREGYDDHLAGHITYKQPDGTFLVTTPNVPAANLTVDLFRSLYTLNWEIVLDGTGKPQPSITQWLPPAPPPSRWTPEGTR